MKKRILSTDLDSSLIGKKVTFKDMINHYGLVTAIDYVKNQVRVSWHRISDDKDLNVPEWLDISDSPVYLYEKKLEKLNYVFDF